MDNKRGSKLHSIIEKLSEQCVRVDDSPPEQQNFNVDEEHIVIINAPPADQNQRHVKPKRGKKKSRKTAELTPTSSNTLSRTDDCQRVDDDLCIDVNALMCITPQVKDIDIEQNEDSSCLSEHGVCRLCFRVVKNRAEFLGHFRTSHPDCIKKTKHSTGDQQTYSESEPEPEDEEGDPEAEDDLAYDSDYDPNFDPEQSECTDSVITKCDSVITKCRRRRSARLKAKNNDDVSNEAQENSEEVVDANDDVQRCSTNTLPKLDFIDLPKTKEFTCKLCEEKYYFKIELSNHMMMNHPDSNDAANPLPSKYNCEHCQRRFLSRNNLLLHINKVVRRIESRLNEENRRNDEKEAQRIKKVNQRFPCKECGKKFKTHCAMKKHLTSHSDERPYTCEICGKRFKDKSYVYRHKRVHSGIKNFQCEHCMKFFAHQGSLRSHIMLHTGERPFKCQYCDAGFIGRFDLKVHENKHTGNMPYKCTLCPKTFPKANNLKMHMISHSTEKPFPCQICGKAFKRNDHLRYHLIIHSDNKPFKCDTCNKTFNQHICLRKHLPCKELEKIQKKANKTKELKPRKLKASKRLSKDDKGSSTGKANNDADAHNEDGTSSVPPQTDTTLGSVVHEQRLPTSLSPETEASDSQIQVENSENPGLTSLESVTVDATKDQLDSSNLNLATQKTNFHLSNAGETDGNTSDGLSALLDRPQPISLVVAQSHGDTINFDKLDFTSGFQTPGHAIHTVSSMGSFSLPTQRLLDSTVYSSNIPHTFVPFNCSTPDTAGVVYESGALELDSLQPVGSHDNILSNRTFSHVSGNDLSSALLAAIDPDHLNTMVNSVSFFPQP